MSLAKVYHYTEPIFAQEMIGKYEGRSGIYPNSYFGIGLEGEPPPCATFALLEPTPRNWTENPHFPNIWSSFKLRLIRRTDTVVLVEIDIDTITDKVVVADRAHAEGYSNLDLFRNTLPPHLHYYDRTKSAQAFMDSAIPLGEYLKREQTGERLHLLPEVLILDEVPAERIQVAKAQPLIEDGLIYHRESATTFDISASATIYNEMIVEILGGGLAVELIPWRRQFEAKHGPLEIIGRGKERK